MKALLQQWQDDCERLSEPEKQWKVRSQYDENLWHKALSKDEINFYLTMDFDIRRIESLALPFDLEDAMNGGKVEYLVDNDLWNDCEFISIEKNVARVKDTANIYCCVENLRMKESLLKTTGVKK